MDKCVLTQSHLITSLCIVNNSHLKEDETKTKEVKFYSARPLGWFKMETQAICLQSPDFFNLEMLLYFFPLLLEAAPLFQT